MMIHLLSVLPAHIVRRNSFKKELLNFCKRLLCRCVPIFCSDKDSCGNVMIFLGCVEVYMRIQLFWLSSCFPLIPFNLRLNIALS